MTANPTNRFAVVYSSTNTGRFRIYINSGGTIDLDNGGTTLATSTNTISLNAWARIEFHMLCNTSGNGDGKFEVKLSNTMDSSTPTETVTASNISIGTSQNSDIEFGNATGTVSTGTFWIDDLVANAASYPGPVASAAAVIPIVNMPPMVAY